MDLGVGMMGAGKYDAICTSVRHGLQAQGVILIVLEGVVGNGFSVQATMETTLVLPELLRRLADQIEADAVKHVS